MKEDLPLHRTTLQTDIVFGERYRDEHTGFEGVATSITFYEHGCERVVLEGKANDDGKSEVVSFDAPRVTHLASGQTPQATRTGGPGNIASNRTVASR